MQYVLGGRETYVPGNVLARVSALCVLILVLADVVANGGNHSHGILQFTSMHAYMHGLTLAPLAFTGHNCVYAVSFWERAPL